MTKSARNRISLPRTIFPFILMLRRILLPYLRRCFMTLCPIALIAGCQKCPVVKICPVKGIIGNYKEGRAPGENVQESGK